MMTPSPAVVSLSGILSQLESDLADTRQAIPLFKTVLADARQALSDEFDAGVAVDELTRARSDFMDGILKLAWDRFDWIENKRAFRSARIALIAVGGYGRRELLPHSDIDVMILLERPTQHVNRGNIQSFTTLLWDIGLEVGHSVRTLKDCKQQAQADVTVLTAMLESRQLIGDEELMEKLARHLNHRRVWPSRFFYRAKREEQRQRHAESDHTEYSLEPNLKSSPGGLRDIQTINWIAMRHWGLLKPGEMVDAGILTETEQEELEEARQHLVTIRFALHLMAGRDENRLLFENQQKLAARFGYEDGDQLAVEQFMQSYYRTAQRVNTLNDILLQNFEETIVQANTNFEVRPVNDRFQVINNQLEVRSQDVFQKHPSALIEMFTIVGGDETILGFRSSTIRSAREHVHQIDDSFRSSSENAGLFLQLLGSNNHLFTQLRRMARWGILGAYLPEFARVIGQMQFDLFHIYTVDAHTLQVVRNMRRFRYRNNEQQFPIAAHIHARLPRIELLYIAGLYHDIAKGMGGDHSELGIGIVRNFCERHGLANWDTNLVCWLVENHLVMSTTSQRKDLQDPEVIHEFAALVGDQIRLDYLYALTVADINATNPTLWNGWKASLMAQLYNETKKLLRSGVETSYDRDEYIEETRMQALTRLSEHDIDGNAVQKLWSEVDDDYFVRERVSDIVWHAEGIHYRPNKDEPVVLLRDEEQKRIESGFTQIFVHTRDRAELFVSIVSAIDQLGLDIVDAGIATSAAGLTFNTFTVLETDGQPVGNDPERVSDISATIRRFIMDKDTSVTHRRTPRAFRNFQLQTQVHINQHPRLPQTAVEIITPDRPGLLTNIGRIFARQGISIASARITTLGERVEDMFYVTDTHGNPITDPQQINEIRSSICDELDQKVLAS